MSLQPLLFEHQPAELEFEASKFRRDALMVRLNHDWMTLSVEEVQRVVDWLRSWLAEGKDDANEC